MNIRLEFNYPEDEDNLKKFVQAVGGREWVGLTGFEQKELMAMSAREAVFATEAKLRSKNT